MTIPIQLSGALSMISTNGDGPALLAQAAKFVQAMAGMGVTLAVEVHLRPLADALSKPAPTIVAVQPLPDIPAPNPTPAAPSTTGAPQTHQRKASKPGNRSAGEVSWRQLSHDERRALAGSVLADLSRSLNHPPTQTEFDAARPDGMTQGANLPTLFGLSWRDLSMTAYQSATATATPSGESA